MIRSFRSKGLQRFAEKGDASKLSVQNIDWVERIINRLMLAKTPDDMNSPGLYFHQLGGDQTGRFSVRVTGNWRITFGWEADDAIEVDLEDYH